MTLRVALILLSLACMMPGQAPGSEPTREELERQIENQLRLLTDWAGLTRYGSDNAELPLAAGEDRVVFLGDEITERWGQGGGQGGAKFFPGKPYLNRGIAGQTTPQMLVRFRQDVIALKPKAVVILAGSNDIAGVAGPITEGMAAENFMSMLELATANGIRVVLASVTPVCDCFRNVTARRPHGKLLGINRWLREYAKLSGAVFLDYFTALSDGRAMKKEFTVDGMIPNDAGYGKMSELAEKAIAEALAKR